MTISNAVPPPSGPLQSVRVVEFAGLGPGPFAAMLLADLGADVVRIDRLSSQPLEQTDVISRGRPTIVADLKSPEVIADILALLDCADALIEGFRPGVMERLGLGPSVVLARNPRLAYGRMTGWGQDGPLAHAAGHDINYIAVTGALAAIGPAKHPVPPLNLVGDYGGGALYLALGLLAAVLSARETGRGQVVDCAICDGAASLMSLFTQFAAQGRARPGRAANVLDGGAPYYRTYVCADGRHVCVGALENPFYRLLCERAGLPEPAFAEREEPEAWPGLHARFAALFRTRTRAEWCALLEGTDACFAPVLDLAEAPDHHHLAARRTFVERGGVVQPEAAPRFSGTPASARAVDGRRLTPAQASSLWTER